MQAYTVLSQKTSIPLVISERLATRFQYREMLEARAGQIVMYDLTWCGGISEGKKISDMANTYLAAAISNLFYVESVYPNWTNRYPYFFENTPQVVNGYVHPPELPGLGLIFKDGLFDQNEVVIETIAEG